MLSPLSRLQTGDMLPPRGRPVSRVMAVPSCHPHPSSRSGQIRVLRKSHWLCPQSMLGSVPFTSPGSPPEHAEVSHCCSPTTLAACCPPRSSRGNLKTHVGGVATLPPVSPSSTGKGEPTLSRPPRPACPALTRHFARPPQLSHFLLALCSSVFLHLAQAPQRLRFLCSAL